MGETDKPLPHYPDFQLIYLPIRQYWKLALGILILIMVFSLIKGTTEKKYFQVTFFITCHYPLIEDLRLKNDNIRVYDDPSFSQPEMKTLAQNFLVAEQKLEASLRQVTVNTSRTTRENNAFEVIMQVYDSSKVVPLMNDFVRFLNNNHYLSSNIEKDQKHYENILKEIEIQIKLMPQQDPEKIVLVEKREFILSKLDKTKGFEVSVPPVNKSSYANMPLMKQLVLSLIWGTIVSVIIAFIVGILRPGNIKDQDIA
jgi:hypothetical protein